MWDPGIGIQLKREAKGIPNVIVKGDRSLEDSCAAGTDWSRSETTLKKREKVGLKLNIQKTKIMASGPITS